MTTTSANSLLNTSSLTNSLSSAATGSGSTSTDALATLGKNFNQFLTLLTAELKNQDPTKPMDTTEMTNQLALFSNVEQTVGINTRLDKLLSAQQTNSAVGALGYIGHTIEANGDRAVLASGKADIAYEMPSAAETVRVDVLNSAGSVIKTLSGDATAGVHHLTWDGTDSSGATCADGPYKLSITANTGSADSTVTPVARTTGTVTGVESSGTDTLLNIGTLQVKMSDVLAIR